MNKNTMKGKIGVIGVGFVGGAVYKYFKAKGYKPLVFDKYKKLGSEGEVNRAEIVFICVPTPFKKSGGFDLSAVKQAIGILKTPKIVVIKSSVIPGTTESLQKKYSKHKIMFNPEFLKEVSAYEDFINPDRQILGVTKKSKKSAKTVMSLLPRAPFKKVMASQEAEMVKYMANTFLSLKVVFANQIFKLCKKLGLNYEDVKTAVGHDKRITHSHLNVNQDAYRGYGGSCFPKDVNALIQLAEQKKVDLKLLKSMREVNRKLLKDSGISEEYFLKDLHKKRKNL